MGYRRQYEGKDERRLYGPIARRVKTRRGADEEMADFRQPHPKREKVPNSCHNGILQGQQEGGRHGVTNQNGEEGGLGVGLVNPSRGW